DKKTPKEGTRWLVATFTMRNGLGKTANAQRYAYHTYEFNLIDADGEREKFDGYLIKASRDEHADGELKPGEEARFRIFFEVPANVGVKTITAKEGDARTYSFDVSGAK
ncbi:MAG TPA: DUF4352 domain-containing protein, partial [Deinococcales bacterium]|nr:DUF4352 domain-containing protein [Deinococcales bacterium]